MATVTEQIQALNDAVNILTQRVDALTNELNSTNLRLGNVNNYTHNNIQVLNNTVTTNRTDMDDEDVELHREIHSIYENYTPNHSNDLIYTSAFVFAQISGYLNDKIDSLNDRVTILENS